MIGIKNDKSWEDPEEGTGGPDTPSLKNHKKSGFLSNTCPDPLKNHEATKPEINFGHNWHASEAQFKWRFTGRPMMTHFCGIWIISPLIN